MRPGLRAPRPGPPAARLSRSSLRLQSHRSELEYVELRRALGPWNDQPPFERADPVEHAGHVALGIVAVRKRLLFVAQSEAAEENQPARIVIFPQSASRPLAAGLLDDRQQVAFNL